MPGAVEECGCAEVVADVIGSTKMRAWVDGTFLKEAAGGNGTPWHKRRVPFPFSGSTARQLGGADHMGPDNALLLTLAGSTDPHRYVSFPGHLRCRGAAQLPSWSELRSEVSAPDADIRVWEAAPGTCLTFIRDDSRLQAPRPATPGAASGFSLRWIGSDIPLYQFKPYGQKNRSRERVVKAANASRFLMPVTWRRPPARKPPTWPATRLRAAPAGADEECRWDRPA